MDPLLDSILSNPDQISHFNNPVCLLLKIGIIKLMSYYNAPVLFRTPEFLSSMTVIYFESVEKFLVLFNFSTSTNATDLFPYAIFIVNMKHWQRNNQNLFINLDFNAPRITFILDHDGCLNVFLLIHDLFGNFFSNLQDHGLD